MSAMGPAFMMAPAATRSLRSSARHRYRIWHPLQRRPNDDYSPGFSMTRRQSRTLGIFRTWLIIRRRKAGTETATPFDDCPTGHAHSDRDAVPGRSLGAHSLDFHVLD